MRVFIAGGTGVVGQRLIPMLTAAGHEVTATTRSPGKAGLLREFGATPVVVDGLDASGLLDAVHQASPEVVIHQMTALSSMKSLRRFDKEFAVTSKLRTAGTDNLLAAARAAGTRRFIAQSHFLAQSYAGLPGVREGGPVKAVQDPLLPTAPTAMTQAIRAIRHLEQTVSRFPGGIVLRYGNFYGPGASEPMLDAVRKRQFPVIGGGTGVWSFSHIEDAATAAAAAVTRGAPGIYNAVDDDPAPVAQWLPFLASCLDAKRPLRLPVWLGRILAGESIVSMMTEIRGLPNEQAKRELGWSPRYPSWRDGFPVWAGTFPAPGAAHDHAA
jgi:nucleoside-diphosphate-sugar epimerase